MLTLSFMNNSEYFFDIFIQEKRVSNISYQIFFSPVLTPAGPTGPTGPTGATGALASAFGGYYMTDTGSLNLTATPITVPLDLQSSVSDQVAYTALHQLTIEEAGTYLVTVTMSGRSITVATSITLALSINGTAQTGVMQSQEFSVAELNTFVFSNILELNDGDELGLLISAEPDTLFSTPQLGQSAGLVVLRIA